MMKKVIEKKQPNKKVWTLILPSIVVYIIINLMDYSRDVSLWPQALTDTTFIIFTTFIFLIVVGIITLFLSWIFFFNELSMALKRYYFGISIPSLVLAVLVQQAIFYIIFYDGTQQFFSLYSLLIPVLIAGAVHLFMTGILLRWYTKMTLKQGLKIGFIYTIIPLIILIIILMMGSFFAGMGSI